jgi:hypothetical protein
MIFLKCKFHNSVLLIPSHLCNFLLQCKTFHLYKLSKTTLSSRLLLALVTAQLLISAGPYSPTVFETYMWLAQSVLRTAPSPGTQCHHQIQPLTPAHTKLASRPSVPQSLHPTARQLLRSITTNTMQQDVSWRLLRRLIVSFFAGTGIWIHGFVLVKQHSTAWATPPVHFALVIFWRGGLQNYLLGPPTSILPISTSQEGSITGMSH